jgi:hypothetical protein
MLSDEWSHVLAMGVAIDREELLWAFDRLARAAVAAGARLEIAVYGGSALMLASNFRYTSEDVDVSLLSQPWPEWLQATVMEIAAARGWSPEWFNDAVEFHLSPLADRAADHLEFGSFPRNEGPIGLAVHVPTPAYMLALKLKGMRVADPVRGEQEARDIVNLIRVLEVRSPDEAIKILGRYFPKSAADPGKQRFLLNLIWDRDGGVDAPAYPVRSI